MCLMGDGRGTVRIRFTEKGLVVTLMSLSIAFLMGDRIGFIRSSDGNPMVAISPGM